MKRALVPCAFVLALSATGCATTPEPAAARLAAPASAGPTIETDHAYIQRVQQLALRRGIGVTWVNPPVKRRARTGE